MAHVEVRNWEKFQHYKHRNPPWIRLYIALLDDPEFARLPDVTKAHLVAIWMLAGRYHNKLPADLGWLEQKMNVTEEVNWKKLLSDGWVTTSEDASKLLATCKQNACTEQSRAEQSNNGAHAPGLPAVPLRATRPAPKPTRAGPPKAERRAGPREEFPPWVWEIKRAAIASLLGDYGPKRILAALADVVEREKGDLSRIIACMASYVESTPLRYRLIEKFGEQLPGLLDEKYRKMSKEELKHEIQG